MRVGKSEASKRVMGPAPDSPANMRFHVGSTPVPNGDTIPSPVTTTRRMQSPYFKAEFIRNIT